MPEGHALHLQANPARRGEMARPRLSAWCGLLGGGAFAVCRLLPVVVRPRLGVHREVCEVSPRQHNVTAGSRSLGVRVSPVPPPRPPGAPPSRPLTLRGLARQSVVCELYVCVCLDNGRLYS